MKIVVFEQQNCAWCTRLHPHIKKLAKDFETELTFVNITNKWEIADQYNFRTTPTVAIIDDDVVLRKFSIQPGKGIAELISEIKDFITT